MRNILLVIAGPSGVGKGTLVKELLKGENLSLSISCTTRPPRSGEREGASYFFLPREKFLSLIEEGEFLEYDEHFGNFYGTPKSFVEEKLKKSSVVLEIDVVGALKVKERYEKAVLVFIAPPDRETLYLRLKGRNTESEEELSRRMLRADYELSESTKFDYVLCNDRLDETVSQLKAIINREKERE